MSEAIMSEEKQSGDTNNNDDESETGSNPMDGQICRDYQRGVCNRGGKCKFGHPDGLGKEIESGPMICRDFQNGKCNRGTCKYLHISNSEEKVYLRTGQLPARRPSPMHGPPPPPPMRGGFGGYQTRANRSDPICKDFLNSKCTRGAACKYRHAYEDEVSYGGFGGYEDFPRKRRRESFGDSDFAHVKEENDSLRRQVTDLQKQVSDLKATNEVLLEQNARYRNQASGSTSYPPTPSYPTSYASKPTPLPAPQSYSTSYPSTYNGSNTVTYTTATSYTSYSADTAAYTSTANYGATTSDTSIYSSSYPTGTGYIKFG
ncbi:hypothetical protein QZH41_005112 [Actinostola sp. cb2023]|nr:hypothetical protein QZH41_005112 [Actinostola sp. cb2023]